MLGMPYPFVLYLVGQELLLYEVAGVIMRVFVSIAVAQVGHQFGGGVSEMKWHGQVSRPGHELLCGTDALIRRIALRTGSEIYRSLGERYT